MKRMIIKITALILFLSATSALAQDAKNIYQEKCISCHQLKGMMDMSQKQEMRKKMQNASEDERKKLKEDMKRKMEKSGMKAPAMNMISMRLKMKTKSKDEFIHFVKDYIQNPSQEKGHCMPMAYKRFGVMPAIGKGMNKDELESIAIWLYENFNGSWQTSEDAKACNKNNGK